LPYTKSCLQHKHKIILVFFYGTFVYQPIK